MAGDWFGGPTSPAPTDPAQFTDWLNEALERPLLIVALCRAGALADGGNDPLAGWRAQLQAYPGVRLLMKEAGDAPDATTLSHIAQLDPGALLVCEDARDSSGAATSGDWRAAILSVAEGLNLF